MLPSGSLMTFDCLIVGNEPRRVFFVLNQFTVLMCEMSFVLQTVLYTICTLKVFTKHVG